MDHLGAVLQALHGEMRVPQCATDRQGTVMCKEDDVVRQEERRDRFTELFSSRMLVWCERHRTHAQHEFGKNAVGNRFADERERGGVWRMRVDHGADVGSRAAHRTRPNPT